MNKKTLVLGASENPARYSNMAIHRLLQHNHDVVAIGCKVGVVNEVKIEIGFPPFENVDTITMYLNAMNQKPYYDHILSLKPKRIIFNPGAENDELEKLALENNIECIEACTLVMLGVGTY